ncbi:MAG: GspH/FimT family pseudopilin [Burkholderiales bacterium]|nr:GspH/FimT family pseudopilin [Burkholderiales bacterium]
MRQLTPRRGVTLIEVLIGLVITAILAVAAAPYYVDYIQNARLREGGDALLAEALYAQSEALKRNTVVRLSADGNELRVTDVGVAVPVVLRSRALTEGLTGDGNTVDFGSDGMTRPAGTAVQIDIAYTGLSCTNEYRCPRLTVEAGGAMRLCANKLNCP